MKFCTQCDNMYYLGVNENNINELIYYCRNCKYVDNTIITEGSCIINTHSNKNNSQFNHVINEYTKVDPTLPRMNNIKCPNVECKSNLVDSKNYQYPEVIYLRYDDANMKYVYICDQCNFTWKTNDKI